MPSLSFSTPFLDVYKRQTISKTPSGHSRAIVLEAVSLALAIAACGSSSKSGSAAAPGSDAQASAYVYWANNTIGRGSLNGTSVNQHFIAAGRVRMVAVASRDIYWSSDNNTIGRANLNGTGVNQRFLTGASGPVGVAVNSKYVYWANNSTGTIGRANLNGTGVNQRFITCLLYTSRCV